MPKKLLLIGLLMIIMGSSLLQTFMWPFVQSSISYMAYQLQLKGE